MDYRLIILGSCNCGQCITVDMMISPSEVKCINCNLEYLVHMELEPQFTLEEWEQMEAAREEICQEELTRLPF